MFSFYYVVVGIPHINMIVLIHTPLHIPKKSGKMMSKKTNRDDEAT